MSVRFGNSFIAGNLSLKVQDKIYTIKRSMESGTEYYTVQVPTNSQFFISTASRYAFLVDGTNTTTNPKLRLGSQILDIKNNLGNFIAVGDLIDNSLQEMYCIDLDSNEIRMSSGTDSYNSLTDKPAISNIPLTNGSTYESLGLSQSKISGNDSVLLIKTNPEYTVAKVGNRTISDTTQLSYVYGNTSSSYILESSKKPYWYNGITYNQLATLEDVNSIYVPDNYKGFANYAVEYFEDLAAFVAKNNDVAFVTSESAKYRYTDSAWKKVEMLTPRNGDYYEIEQFSDGLSGRIIYDEDNSQWDYFRDNQGIPDGVTITKDEQTHLVSVLRVPKQLTFVVNDTENVFDGSEEVSVSIDAETLNVYTKEETQDYISQKLSEKISANESVNSNNLIVYNYSINTIEDTGVPVSNLVTRSEGKIFANNISMSNDDATTIFDKLEKASYLDVENTFSKTNTFSAPVKFNSTAQFSNRPTLYENAQSKNFATEDQLYDDSTTLKVTSQTWTSEQKSQARANIGAGTSSFDGNYLSLSNIPTLDGKSISGTLTKKGLGIYPAPVLAKSGNNEVVSDSPSLTVEAVSNLVTKSNGTIVPVSTAQAWFSGLGTFNIHHAYINGVTYTNFSTFNNPINFAEIRYNKIRYVTNDDGTVETVEDTIYFDVNSSPGNIVYKVKQPDRIDPSVTNLLTVPTVLQAKEPFTYQFSDTYIVNGGSGYSINDVVYASTFAITVTAVNSSGAITGISQFSDEVKNEERTTNYAGDYSVTGGNGSGAILRLRTHYTPGNFVNRGTLSNTNDTDPIVQESFVLGQILKAVQVTSYYGSGNKSSESKYSFNDLTNSVEMSYDEYSDATDPVNTISIGLTLGTINGKTGAWLRNLDGYGLITTEQDVLDIIGTSYAGSYLGNFTYFANKSDIMSQSAASGSTAITKDTFELGTYNSSAWTWTALTSLNGSYADVDKLLDNPTPTGYASGTVKLFVDGDDKSWVIRINEQGQADGITLQQNADTGTIGFKFDANSMLSGANGTNIRIDSNSTDSSGNPMTVKKYVDTKISTVNSSISELTSDKIDKFNYISNRLVISTSTGITNADFTVSDVLRLSTDQIITGRKTFDSNTATTFNTDLDGAYLYLSGSGGLGKAVINGGTSGPVFYASNGNALYFVTYDGSRPKAATGSWLGPQNIEDIAYVSDFSDYVPITRTVNNKALSSNITLTAADVGALTQSTADTRYQPVGNYLTSIPSEYTTETEVNNIVTSKGYITASALSGYATQTWVTSQGYLTSVPSTYATQTWVNNQGFATQSWVTSKGYVTTDSKVKQFNSTNNATYPLLFSSTNTSSIVTRTAAVFFNNNIKVNPSTGELWATKVYNAVFNDYAEYRKSKLKVAAGKIVCEVGNDEVRPCTNKRNKSKLFVVTDTYGSIMGNSENSVPVALAGRVLVHVENKDKLKVGDYIGCNKNAIGRKISKIEALLHPERVVGTVSSIPDYEYWGNKPFQVKVNGRVWVNVR